MSGDTDDDMAVFRGLVARDTATWRAVLRAESDRGRMSLQYEEAAAEHEDWHGLMHLAAIGPDGRVWESLAAHREEVLAALFERRAVEGDHVAAARYADWDGEEGGEPRG
ncbi:hypothetical protein [Kineococcus sp. SYSU DK002]|uniref:hypothetical protein n=1 Tax=Kineococcus sp. SYSU DK002 TaxID=3383123 RepID=UPI003D7C8584